MSDSLVLKRHFEQRLEQDSLCCEFQTTSRDNFCKTKIIKLLLFKKNWVRIKQSKFENF